MPDPHQIMAIKNECKVWNLWFYQIPDHQISRVRQLRIVSHCNWCFFCFFLPGHNTNYHHGHHNNDSSGQWTPRRPPPSLVIKATFETIDLVNGKKRVNKSIICPIFKFIVHLSCLASGSVSLTQSHISQCKSTCEIRFDSSI